MNSHDSNSSLIIRLKTILLYGSLAAIIFTVVYGQSNKLASVSDTLYPMYLDWELQIPLIPWMIYPYISLNLLFITAAFFLRTKESIKALCLSITWGAIIAGIIFYFFPGELGFKRVEVPGYENIFNFMFAIDHPHNLFPSLHITYAWLVISAIKQNAYSKIVHFVMESWRILITLSVVLVHQHHLFDIFTGGILAHLLLKFIYQKHSTPTLLQK
jgi:hypothetical protein